MLCPNCHTQNPPHAKFCLECGNRLVVCPNCGTVNLPVAKYCIECGTSLAKEATIANRTASELSAKANDPGKTFSQHESSTQPLPDVMEHPEERRIVTIMFADITGSTPLADHLDPEDLRAILGGYFNLMTQQIRRHGGTVEKYIGDAVMAVFGLPIAHEDDPDRAVRAALDMQTALHSYNERRRARDPNTSQLQMRIGINTGEVAAPNSAHFSRHDFLVTGDAVNVAARLQQVATPDTILIGERTYQATREVFTFRALAPLHLRGKPEPLRAWVVQSLQEPIPAITQHPRGIEGLASPLVGRSLELTMMHATFARVQAERQPHLITLLGPPGIGKSRLMREFIALEQERSKSTTSAGLQPGSLVMRGRCPPYGEGITYWPLIEILRTLLKVEKGESDEEIEARFITYVQETLAAAKRSEDPQEIASAILRSIGRGLSGLTLDQSGERRQRNAHPKPLDQNGSQMTLLRSWRVFLEALAQRQPLTLVIDDLQWADEALLDLLEHLMERLNNVPILFLCPTRPEFFERRRDWGGGQKNFTTIVLETLSDEEASELINALLRNNDLPDALCNAILSRAEGNPFFVEEIIRMLIDQGVLVFSEEGCWHVGQQNEAQLSDLANPAGPPEDTLLDQHYMLPLPRVPDTIQGVLAARVDLLNAIEKYVLQQASIIGRTFWLSGLRELTPELSEEGLLATLDALVERNFIVETEQQGRSPVEPDRVFSFQHILIRDVVYNNLSRVRRSQEHARLALWLEEKTVEQTETFVELLAYHYQQAVTMWPAGLITSFASSNDGAERPEGEAPLQLSRAELQQRAINYLTLAGDQALHSYYTIRAIQAYSEALDLLIEARGDSNGLARMHEKLGDAFAQRANTSEAWQEYRQALQLLKVEPVAEDCEMLPLYDRLAELATRFSGWFTPEPDWQEVRGYIDAGLRLSEDQPLSGDRAIFLTYLAMWYMRQQGADAQERAENATQALENGLEAFRIAEAAQDPVAQWLTLDALGAIYLVQFKYKDAHTAQHRRQLLAEQVKKYREELHDLYYSLGWSHNHISDYATAARWFGESWRIAQTMESPSLLLVSMLGRMSVWFNWDRWKDAYAAGLEVLQVIDQYQLDEKWQVKVLDYLAVIAYRLGNDDESERYQRHYRRLLDLNGAESDNGAMLLIHLARENWEQAFAQLQEDIQRSEPFPSPFKLSHLSELVVITQQSLEEQRIICERAVEVTTQAGARKYQAIALRARGQMQLEQQNWEPAETDMQEALQIFKELDLPWERGQTFYSLGELYRRRAENAMQESSEEYIQDQGRARYHFEKALGFFESLKAVHDIERVRLALNHDKVLPI